jgi:superfamily II RNA helicase
MSLNKRPKKKQKNKKKTKESRKITSWFGKKSNKYHSLRLRPVFFFSYTTRECEIRFNINTQFAEQKVFVSAPEPAPLTAYRCLLTQLLAENIEFLK